jgi:cell division protein FtsZ
MREYQEVMTTIKEFTADDALVIVGTVIDDAMDDRLRVTMIATGLGGAQAVKREQVRAPSMTLVEQAPQVVARTGTDNVGVSIDNIDYQNFDAPAVIRRRERGGPAAPMIDSTEIPAFLRKQAD